MVTYPSRKHIFITVELVRMLIWASRSGMHLFLLRNPVWFGDACITSYPLMTISVLEVVKSLLCAVCAFQTWKQHIICFLIALLPCQFGTALVVFSKFIATSPLPLNLWTSVGETCPLCAGLSSCQQLLTLLIWFGLAGIKEGLLISPLLWDQLSIWLFLKLL